MEWQIGEKLPSEGELAEAYASSRVTIRQALGKLAAEGFVDKQRGRGTYVKTNPSIVVQELYLPQAGQRYQSNVVSSDAHIVVAQEPGPQVLNRLQLPLETPVVYLERLFLQRKRVVGLNRAWFPLHLVPGMADQPLLRGSITDTLRERYGIEIVSVDNYIESISMDAATAHIMDTVYPSPGLRINSIYMQEGQRPVQYAVTTWNGRDTQFHVVLSSQ